MILDLRFIRRLKILKISLVVLAKNGPQVRLRIKDICAGRVNFDEIERLKTLELFDFVYFQTYQKIEVLESG